jgi:hypothetical protein
MSAAGRKAIGDAARRRWAEYHNRQNAAKVAAQKPVITKTTRKAATAKTTAPKPRKAAKKAIPAKTALVKKAVKKAAPAPEHAVSASAASE